MQISNTPLSSPIVITTTLQLYQYVLKNLTKNLLI